MAAIFRKHLSIITIISDECIRWSVKRNEKKGRGADCRRVLKELLRIDYSSPMATLTALMAKVMVRPMAIPAIRQG